MSNSASSNHGPGAAEPATEGAHVAPASASGVVIDYPRSAIVRRFFPPMTKPTHPVTAWLHGLAGQVLPTLFMLVVLLGVWQLACGSPTASLPGPFKVWTDSHDVIMHPLKGVSLDGAGLHIEAQGDVGIAAHILKSLGRVLIGYGLAAVMGVLLGMLVGTNIFAYRALDPLFQVLRTVPPLAWLPLSLAVFQQVQPSAIFLIFITAIWPIILNTSAGVQNLPPAYRNVARVLALNPFEYFVRIVLPATVPHIFTGLRIGIGMSWLAIVAAEMVQGGTGIGFFIWDSYNSSLLSDTIVALIWIGMVGFALDRIVALIGRLVARA
jgi:nitrate/nitrite transport system permease protein